MHVPPVVVANEAHLAKSSHEETDAGACGADHRGEGFLVDLRKGRPRMAFFLTVGQQQQRPRQPLLAGIEELIQQVLLDANVAGQEMGQEQLGEGGVFLQQTDHGIFVEAHETSGFRGARGCGTNCLSGQAGFPQKAPSSSIARTASLPCCDTAVS